MFDNLVKYHFAESNRQAVIFVPGYSGGLAAPVIEQTVNRICSIGGIDVLGLQMDYAHDIPDDYSRSRDLLVRTISDFRCAYPHKNVFVAAKSLGGALVLKSLSDMSIAGLVVLGSSAALGWPQRISHLQTTCDDASFADEWLSMFDTLRVPVTIISGGDDTLADNVFLQSMVERHSGLRLIVIPHADHGLTDIRSRTVNVDGCVDEIKKMLARRNAMDVQSYDRTK